MHYVSDKTFSRIGNDYKGKYSDYDHKHPEWKGRNVAFLPGHGTVLYIEGVSFEILKNIDGRIYDLVRVARTSNPVDKESLASIKAMYGQRPYQKALEQVCEDIDEPVDMEE